MPASKARASTNDERFYTPSTLAVPASRSRREANGDAASYGDVREIDTIAL